MPFCCITTESSPFIARETWDNDQFPTFVGLYKYARGQIKRCTSQQQRSLNRSLSLCVPYSSFPSLFSICRISWMYYETQWTYTLVTVHWSPPLLIVTYSPHFLSYLDRYRLLLKKRKRKKAAINIACRCLNLYSNTVICSFDSCSGRHFVSVNRIKRSFMVLIVRCCLSPISKPLSLYAAWKYPHIPLVQYFFQLFRPNSSAII